MNTIPTPLLILPDKPAPVILCYEVWSSPKTWTMSEAIGGRYYDLQSLYEWKVWLALRQTTEHEEGPATEHIRLLEIPTRSDGEAEMRTLLERAFDSVSDPIGHASADIDTVLRNALRKRILFLFTITECTRTGRFADLSSAAHAFPSDDGAKPCLLVTDGAMGGT